MRRWYEGDFTDFNMLCPMGGADGVPRFCTRTCACLVVKGKTRYYAGGDHITYTARCGLAASGESQICFKCEMKELD